MLREMTEVIQGLGVYPANMIKNMNIYGGVVFSQRVLLALVESGLSREDSYRIVQKHAHKAWNTDNGDFKKNLEVDLEVSKQISKEELGNCFNTDIHQKNLDIIWDRLGI